MGYLLDTSALVQLERAEKSVASLSIGPSREHFVPAVVVAELWFGATLADSEERRNTRMTGVRNLVSTIPVLPFTVEIAPTYAALFATLRKQGTPIPQNDLA